MKTPAEQLATALRVAAYLHEQQFDKGGKPYFLHPMRVAMRLRTDDMELMAIAILHDVKEDHGITDVTLRHLLGLSERVIAGVDAMSRREGESYDVFIERCGANYDAARCKREDLKDNSDVSRLKGLSEKDMARLQKYARAYTRINEWIALHERRTPL